MESAHKTNIVNKLWKNIISQLSKSWGNDAIAKVIVYLPSMSDSNKYFKSKQRVTPMTAAQQELPRPLVD